MSDDRRQEDFAQRLSRISQERGGGITPEPRDQRRDVSDFDYNAPKERHPIRNSIIWVIIFAALGAGGYYGWGAMPQDLKDSLISIATSSGADGDVPASPDDIAETATMANAGPIIASPAVAQIDAAPTQLGEIVTNATVPDANTQIGDILPIERNATCTLRAPAEGEKVLGVRIENALLQAPVIAFSNRQMVDQVLLNIRGVTQNGADSSAEMAIAGQKNSLDVIVTDTSGPLYLVLQNMGPGVIWNLQPAPGVEISHVAIIGSDFSGVTTPQPATTVEALLVSDFLAPYQYGADDAPRDCMIRPWRQPQPDWIGSLKSEAGSLPDANRMSSYEKGYTAYDRWYTGALGIGARQDTVTAQDAAHVLLGPKPAEPIPYQPLANQSILMMQADHLFQGSAADRIADAQNLHNDLLRSAVGGDVALLDPPALERGNQ